MLRGSRLWARNPGRRRESENTDGALARTLTAADYCDRCGAPAYVRVLLGSAYTSIPPKAVHAVIPKSIFPAEIRARIAAWLRP